ncbi:hypothetical protein PIB30_059998 [Stylosanthes scabra]|uniref:RRM domain-containing protein n=1 Tax=Stylosanthes scabra TaxID=79078 RepID=A0ABU6SKE9_9FABA|nr:hypothetical protein [Stylosanthes scabra]
MIVRENQREGEGSGEGGWRVVTRRNPRINNHQARTHHEHRRDWNSGGRNGRGELDKNTVTLFVDNLPRTTTVEWLWNIFGLEGRIAIRRRNGWIIWGCKLQVSEAKYKREDRTRSQEIKKVNAGNEDLEEQRRELKRQLEDREPDSKINKDEAMGGTYMEDDAFPNTGGITPLRDDNTVSR